MSELLLLIDEAQSILAGDSNAAARLRTQVERIARTPRTTVLLLGERGLEFERVARCIHLHSEGKGVFLPVASQTLSAKPSQVDAFGCAGGLCERARGGTLFLDEVTDLDADLQGDLLRRLEDRLHPADPKHAAELQDPRIVASSAQDLDALVQAGEFRSDLFYRLNVLTIRVPSLRERSEDLGILAQGILQRQGALTGRRRSLGDEALARLQAHAWPAGLLELEAVLTQALLRCPGSTIQPQHLSLETEGSLPAALIPAASPARSIRATEEALIRRVLVEEEGNRSGAARALGINRTTLYNKLRQYGIA